MSAAEFQKRIADLTFSAKQHINALKIEEHNSSDDYAAWQDEGEGLDGDDLEAHNADEPEVIDHSEKIAHIETAIGHLEAAVDELDGALDD